jgi:exodeoxyribonuclease V alpha subunit
LDVAARLASWNRREGNICVDLPSIAGTTWGSIALPPLDTWTKRLRETSVVGKPGEFTPLVLDATDRLYLHRYWDYETRLATAIRRRVASDDGLAVDENKVAELLRRLFPDELPGETNWQKVAAFTALSRRFCVISGGPGTGKTRTVVMLLALLLELVEERPLRIALAAPTDKAAARLQESLRKLKSALPCSDSVKSRLPEESFTLHRLLGSRPDSAFFKHHLGNLLPFDVVIIDEASMVDLALMTKLVEAVPPDARLILLGDRDQLASVEAGSVLGDICDAAGANRFTPAFADFALRVTGQTLPMLAGAVPSLADCVVQLERNYRFGSTNGLLALSRAVNSGDASAAMELLLSAASGAAIASRPLPARSQLKATLRDQVIAGFSPVLDATDAAAALAALAQFRILCALREGPFGVSGLNRFIEEILREAGTIPEQGLWYRGRPVMVTRNDYSLELFNGDVGVLWPDPVSGQPRAWFADAKAGVRAVLPLRLPEHETAFAMTVHKSQGSEFAEVLLLLPDRPSPVLSRELIYTGLTRASKRAEVWFTDPMLREALAQSATRTSGLQDQLKAPAKS